MIQGHTRTNPPSSLPRATLEWNVQLTVCAKLADTAAKSTNNTAPTILPKLRRSHNRRHQRFSLKHSHTESGEIPKRCLLSQESEEYVPHTVRVERSVCASLIPAPQQLVKAGTDSVATDKLCQEASYTPKLESDARLPPRWSFDSLPRYLCGARCSGSSYATGADSAYSLCCCDRRIRCLVEARVVQITP